MEYPTNCDELARKAANPDSMGPPNAPNNGRKMETPQERDSNHPMGTNKRAGLPGGGAIPDPNV